MDARPREIRYYVTPQGRAVVLEWLDALGDQRLKGRIRIRLERLEDDNFGDVKAIGGPLKELRMHVGPGYRIYFAMDGVRLVLLLCAGDKRTQGRDIATADRYWKNYQSRKKGQHG